LWLQNWRSKEFWHIMAGVGHLVAIPAILIRHTQMVPYVPEKFCFADVLLFDLLLSRCDREVFRVTGVQPPSTVSRGACSSPRAPKSTLLAVSKAKSDEVSPVPEVLGFLATKVTDSPDAVAPVSLAVGAAAGPVDTSTRAGPLSPTSIDPNERIGLKRGRGGEKAPARVAARVWRLEYVAIVLEILLAAER
jgi:hypothetical protein